MVTRTHNKMLTSMEHNSMRKFCISNVAIKPNSMGKQATMYHREHILGYTETMVVTNNECLQDGCPIATCSVVTDVVAQ